MSIGNGVLPGWDRVLTTAFSQFNCGPKGVCIDPPGTPGHVAVWQLVLTGLCILAGAFCLSTNVLVFTIFLTFMT